MLLLTDATEASLWRNVWEFAQQVATFAVAVGAIWATMVRPYMAKKDAERKAETIRRDEARRAEIVRQVEEVVAPVRRQVEAIHKTTHVNGGQNSPPTLRDEVNNVGKQVKNAIHAVGAVAANQAYLSQQFTEHVDGADRWLREARRMLADQGISLPDEQPGLALPDRDPDADI